MGLTIYSDSDIHGHYLNRVINGIEQLQENNDMEFDWSAFIIDPWSKFKIRFHTKTEEQLTWLLLVSTEFVT